MQDAVVCKLCNKSYRILNSHLRRKHGISVEEYLLRFPGSSTYCEDFSKLVSQRNKEYAENNPEAIKERGRKSQEGYIKWRSENPDLDHSYRSLGGSRAAVTMAENRELYESMYRSNGENLNQWKKDNPEVSSAIYRNNLETYRKDPKNSERIHETCVANGKKLREFYETHKEFMDEVNTKNLMTWMNNPENEESVRRSKLNSRRSQGKHVELSANRFNIEFVRSHWEEKFVKLCDNYFSGVESLVYEPLFIPMDGRRYIPDFLVNNRYIVEIKPSLLSGDEDVKLKAYYAERYCELNDKIYVMITEKHLRYKEKPVNIEDFLKLKV